MNKIMRVKNDNFTTISNVFLRDKNLSIKAKGFLAIVMGLPSDWEFSIEGICAILKEGKTAIYNVIDELKENKYCNLVTLRDDKGRIIGSDYTFFEEPYSEKPYMGNPNMDNQPQLNTYIELNKEENKISSMSKNDEQVFIEKIYALYPTKCPKRGTSLGKSRKDKDRIKRLLKLYSMDEIEKVVKHEIEEKYEKQYMQNFSTFLNNFPDPNTLGDKESLFGTMDTRKDDSRGVVIGGQKYR